MLPSAADAEKGVICSFFLAPKATGDLCAEKGIKPEHFHQPNCALIFKTLMGMHEDGDPIDFITLTEWLRDLGQLESAGGAHYITEVSNFIPTAANAGYYLGELHEKYLQREIIRFGTATASRGYDEQSDVSGLLDDLEREFLKIVKLRIGNQQHARSMLQLVKLATAQFEASLENTELELPTGIKGLDKYTDGLVSPEVTFICARPSDGKSCLLLNIAEYLAIERGQPVGIISMEMGDIQCATRLIFSRARLNPRAIKAAGKFETDELEAYTRACKAIAHSPIHIRDDGALTIAEICAQATTWKAKHDIRALFVDHLQLARGGGHHDGKAAEIEFVSNKFKPLAKRLGIPVVVLSQVTESDSGSKELRIKGSRAPEADADNIWVLSHTRDKDGKITETWLNLSKQRDRERGRTVPLIFVDTIQRFSERYQEPEQTDLLPNGAKKGRK